jgi:hypothetical protein
MPSPEELGVAARTPATEVDWMQVRRRLSRLGVTNFALERCQAGWRFGCTLPGSRQHFEAEASVEAEAIDRAITQAENTAPR